MTLDTRTIVTVLLDASIELLAAHDPPAAAALARARGVLAEELPRRLRAFLTGHVQVHGVEAVARVVDGPPPT